MHAVAVELELVPWTGDDSNCVADHRKARCRSQSRRPLGEGAGRPLSRRLPVLPPASSPPRIAATQLPLASSSAPCGLKRTCTSKFSAMRGTQSIPALCRESEEGASADLSE